MIRETLTREDAIEIFRDADPKIMAEWDSLLNFVTPENKADEIMEWHTCKWVLKDKKGRPVAMFGMSRTTETTYTAWCLTVKGAQKRVWGQMARDMREITEIVLRKRWAKRIHAFICRDRPEALAFAEKMGMEKQTLLIDYGVDKDFYLMVVK